VFSTLNCYHSSLGGFGDGALAIKPQTGQSAVLRKVSLVFVDQSDYPRIVPGLILFSVFLRVNR
jgi:hypothetical protein